LNGRFFRVMAILAAEGVSFLARLACGAPPTSLRDAWERASAEEGALAELAARFGLANALGVFVSRYAPEHPQARALVAASLVEIQQRRASLDLLQRLAAHPATSGSGAVVIKGAALALQGLVGDERSFADADVTVEPRRLEAWAAAAADLGAVWQPQHGYEAAHVKSGAGLVEIHSALPGFFGTEAGPDAAELSRFRVPTSVPGLFALAAPAAREVCVQHFVFHHDGSPLHALRALLDLCALEGAGEGDGLSWGGRAEEVRRATRHLRTVARAFREDVAPALQAEFTRTLAGVADRPPAGFAGEVDRWISGEAESGRSWAALLMRRLFPPFTEMRGASDRMRVVTLGRYLARPPALLYRYLRDGRAVASESGSTAAWRRLLRG
jgi:hypothetical protein